jgi:hypothetical protein
MITRPGWQVRDKIDELVGLLSQREPTSEDVEDVCTTAQIMSMCAAPNGWLHIEEALLEWLEPVQPNPHPDPNPHPLPNRTLT